MFHLQKILVLALTIAALCVHAAAEEQPNGTASAVAPTETTQQETKGDAKKKVQLKVGDLAPMFSGIDDKGKKFDAAKHKGKKILIVYFYPADMTGGCTKQACAYRDAIPKLKRKDLLVIGVSGDSVKNHQRFRDEYQLNFPLLADSKGDIAKAFGVKTAKGGSFKLELDGEEVEFERGVTTMRWTFVIDKQWKIAHVDRKVNAAKDSANVLKIVEKLP